MIKSLLLATTLAFAAGSAVAQQSQSPSQSVPLPPDEGAMFGGLGGAALPAVLALVALAALGGAGSGGGT